jgi:PAS domain S-box-containing protein
VDSDILKVHSNYILNWQTIGKEMTITKSIGSKVYEIDNKKTLDVFKYYLGDDIAQNMLVHGVEFPLIFKKNQTDVGRVAVAIDKNEGSITFAGIIGEGTKVRFGYANIEHIENENNKQIKDIYKNKNEGVFIYSCGARRQILGNYLNDEIAMLSKLGVSSGFFTYGEFFHNSVSCQNDLLNITTTFITLNENDNKENIIFDEQNIKKDKKDIALKIMTKLITQTSTELEEYKKHLKYELATTNKNFEESLNYSDQYENAINKMTIVVKTDLNNIISNANEQFCKISAYDKNELIGEKLNRFFQINDKNFESIKPDISYSTITTNISKQNNHYTVAVFYYPVSNIHGEIIEYLYIMHDITEIFQIKEKIEDEKNILKAIFENIPDLMWIKDVDGIFLTCNKRFESFCGETQENIIGKTDYDFVSKELADFFRNNDKIAQNSERPISNFEELIFSSDNHKEYVHTTKSKILKSNGEILGVIGIGRDITSIKENENRLKEQQQELESIFNTTKDGLAVVDIQTNFIKVNKAYSDITGFSEEELLQTSCFALTAPEDKERAKIIFNSFIENGIIENLEKTCLVKNGRIIVTLSASWMPDKKHILLSMKDVTKNRLFEEQSKLAAMGEMIGNIAHQWRQPLSVITTISSGIKLRGDYGELENYNIMPDMDTIMKQAQYLSTTIDDFRNFIKNTNDVKELSLKNTIEKTLSILHSAMINNNIKIILDLKDDMNINGYENELIQSFINIINNARDAIKEHIRNDEDRFIFIKTLKENDTLIITIKDSGGGIEQNAIHRIFEPYFTTKHQNIGTGIGLSMAYKMITQRHNASIDVYNDKYEYNNKKYNGACFKITFQSNFK